MDISEKIKQADSILNASLKCDETSRSQLNQLLKEIVNALPSGDKEILNNQIKSVNLDDKDLTIKDMHEYLKLIKGLKNVHKRKDYNSVYTKKAISINKYTPENQYPNE